MRVFPTTILGTTVEPKIEKFKAPFAGTTAIGTTSWASPISPLKICSTASGVEVEIRAVLNKCPTFTRNIFESSKGKIARSL